MLRPVRTVAPAVDLITTAQAKANLRVDHTDEDELIEALVAAATERLDGWSGILGRCLVNQTWRQDFMDWPATERLRLPFPDVSSITSVVYSDASNVEQTVSSSLYELVEDQLGCHIQMLDSFTGPAVYDDRSDAVRVTFVAGYGAAATDVPGPIRQAAHLMIGHWYANREAVGAAALAPLPLGVDSLVTPYRRRRM